MYSRDSNDATWYLLRYAHDFAPRTPAADDPAPPELDATLFYDDARNVLELLPEAPAKELALLPGLAVAPGGEIYRTDSKTGRVTVLRCDGSEVDVTCESRVFAGPRGLSLDRRGFLYVADARARRVVVLDLADGSVRAILNGGVLQEPVDVAVAPSGRVYVADRQAGKIVMYRSLRARGGSFDAKNAEGLPAAPRPIAVMIEADGSILVADANHPRLLHFAADGTPLADLELSTLVKQLPAGEPALDALERAYGSRPPRFLAGACGPCAPTRDAGVRLAEVHRALRLLRLSLGRSFEATGVFVSAALDSGTLGTTWHKVQVEADLPEGTGLTIETATGDAPFTTAAATWFGPPAATPGALIPFTAEVPDQLVLAPPGRYLRVRATLTSNGQATPSLRAIRILYPRVSYAERLPRVYLRDPEGALFLQRFLALFERMFTGIEDRWEEFSRELNPDAAPREIIDWLACLIDLSFDPSWPLEKRRALVASAMELYRIRGTVNGIRRYVEIYTGERPEVLERFLERPSSPLFLGRRGTVLGCTFRTASAPPELGPLEDLYRAYAHRFTVLVYAGDPCDEEVLLPVVDRIVTVNKPAHTEHELRIVRPDARLGIQSAVGLDFVLGMRELGTDLLDRGRIEVREVS